MRCPACFHLLHTLLQKKIELDVCFQCGGTFLDRGELQAYLSNHLHLEASHPEEMDLEGRKVFLFGKNHPLRECPKCSSLMAPFRYAEASHILLDTCESCGGIWADGGELEDLCLSLSQVPDFQKFAAHKKFSRSLRQMPWLFQRKNLLSRFLPLAIPEVSWNKKISTFAWVPWFVSLHLALLLVWVIFYILQKPVPSFLSQSSPIELLWNLLILGTLGEAFEKKTGALGFFFSALALIFLPPNSFYLYSLKVPLFSLGCLGSGILAAFLLLYPERILLLFRGWKPYRIWEISGVIFGMMWILFLVIQSLEKGFFSPLGGLCQIIAFLGAGLFLVLLKITILENKEIQDFLKS